ncbi:MAG: type II toxin-antitoxin system RelE/ParE family toxin [Rhizobiaceae bacterium]|jgi:mRNA interferase RelE/StbE|nr:type II toxin-antitoxin system RelE/ParE family toxin [Rhizobiaceae bacterium]
MVWKIELDRGAEKELDRLSSADAKRILLFLRDRVAKLEDPRHIGEALRGPDLGKYWKYRVGQFRIIADIQDDAVVILVLRVGHRSNVYRG